MAAMNLSAIQSALKDLKLDAWLFADFRGRDTIAYGVLGLPETMTTRRWYYLIPSQGEPLKLNHRIEPGKLDSLPGQKRMYSRWEELHAGLREMLAGHRRVAMQYSPLNNIPYVSLADAGTVELVRSFDVEVVSSADLVQIFQARWGPGDLEAHLEAGRIVDQICADAFKETSRLVRQNGSTDEYTIARFILDRFKDAGLDTHDTPIIGSNQNSGDPHYEPAPGRSAPIRPGDFVLMDMWAKKPGRVYYDITWTGFVGAQPPEKVQRIFEIVRDARDCAVHFVQDAVKAGRAIQGWQVDDAARGHITKHGFGQYFVHRTGHSIAQEIHANGANMDNLETRDERSIVAGTCFSVEPGIYLPEFGVRSEVNVYVAEKEARVTGAIQRELIRIEA